MKSFRTQVSPASFTLGLGLMFVSSALLPADQQWDDDAGSHYPAFVLPESSLLGAETRNALKKTRGDQKKRSPENKAVIAIEEADRAQLPEIRRQRFEAFRRSSIYKQVAELYPVTTTTQEIGGISTEVFTPSEGIAEKNQRRVLINLHGGAFFDGSRTSSYLESGPIASVGKIKVVSVDYRLAPEYAFPSASEDVCAVYRELLKTYQSNNIGIYGSSAGGVLTAEVVAWFQKEGLPRPGAVGMFCGGAAYWTEGDSGKMEQSRYQGHWWSGESQDNPYFKHAGPNDPLAFPLHSDSVMAKFPPSLLVTTTRDLSLSSVVHTHSVLVKQGVTAELHVWEGLGHCFYFNPNLAESRDVNNVVVRFFDRYLDK